MAHLIDNLGGNTALADLMDCTPNAVSNWRTRGIPWRLRPAIAKLAAERGVPLPADFWEASAA